MINNLSIGGIKSYKRFGDLSKNKNFMALFFFLEIFVNTGPYGCWKFQNATTPTVLMPSEPNFMINKVAIREYKVINVWRSAEN